MNVISRSLRYFSHERVRLVLLFATLAIGTLAALMQIWPMIVLLDVVVSDRPQTTWIHRLFLAPLPGSRAGQIVGLAIITLLLRLVQECASRTRGLVNLRIAYAGLVRVRCDLFRKLQAQSLSYHQSQPQGDAIYRLITDTFGCQTILNVVIDLTLAGFMLLIMIYILASRNMVLTLAAVSVSPFLLAANIFYGRLLSRRTKTAKEADCELTTTVQRSMATMRLVQAYGKEGDEFQRFHRSAHDSIRAWLRLHWQEVCYGLTVSIIFGIGGALVFGYGGYLVWQHQLTADAGMTIGDLMLFMTYLGMLYDPLCKISGSGGSLQSGITSAQRVFEVLDADSAIKDAPGAMDLPQLSRTLALDNVAFHYARGPNVLEGINVEIKPGEMVAFVGSSGGGKTTLLNLLPRFYDPTQGAIRLDDIDVRQIKLQDLRKHIALVLQDTILLPTSIAENIGYGRPGATAEEIRRAAALAGADEFIREFPAGYDTMITEGGQNLSGGQRQRVAIARALLTEAPIIILDEPTSALDPLHEQLLTTQLQSLKGHRTIVLVSHRVQTLTSCDQIFVLDSGRIAEWGTHHALLAQQGRYAAMAFPASLPRESQIPEELAAA